MGETQMSLTYHCINQYYNLSKRIGKEVKIGTTLLWAYEHPLKKTVIDLLSL